MGKCTVFNIERYATEDGNGIRTVVFLKGCRLRCRWCANPESQEFTPQILLNVNTCINCGKCAAVCPSQAISFKEPWGYITDSSRCTLCNTCVDQCFQDARRRMGKTYTDEELFQEIRKDEAYFKMSQGGVTFSGGEPLFYPGTIRQIGIWMKEIGCNTLVETCGEAPLSNLQKVSDAVDFIYFDIKHMNPEKHKQLTGQDNSQILRNLEWLCENYKGTLSVRYPYIPGCNDKEEDLRTFFQYVRDKRNISEIVFLPYHRLGLPKYQGLGRNYLMGDGKSLKKNELAVVAEISAEYGLQVRIQ